MFKDRFREALDIRDMKQADLAKKTGINKAMISQYANGRMVPKTENIMKIAEALDVQEAWLIGKDVSMDRPKTSEGYKSEILKMFDQLDPSEQEAVLTVLKTFLLKK